MSRAAWSALVWTAVVAVLAVLVAATAPRRVVPGRAALVPGLDARTITRVAIERPDAPVVTLELGDHGGARITGPAPGAADPGVVRDLLSAIASARADRWSRGAAAWRRAGLDAPRLRLRVAHGGGETVIAVGTAVAAAGQIWIGVAPDRVALAPAWVGRALDRGLDELRARRLFTAAAPTGIELHTDGVDVVLAGTALVRREAGVTARIDPAVRAALVDALAALALDRFVDGPRAEPRGTLRVLGGAAPAELAWFGPCPGDAARVLVEATIGAGCVPGRALEAVVAAAAAAATSTSPRPLDGTVPMARLEVAGPGGLAGADPPALALRRDGAGWVVAAAGVERPADAALVEALERALAAPATVRRLTASDVAARAEQWRVTDRDGDAQRWQVWRGAAAPGRAAAVAIRRGDEPVVLVLEADAAAAVRGVGPALRDRALIALDPLRVAAVRAAGAAPAALARGELIGEWTVVAPAGAAVAAGAAELPAWLAQLRVERWEPPAALGAVRRTLVLTGDADPGTGAPAAARTLRVGAARPGGCAVATDDGAVGVLPAAACARLLAPLTAPRSR